MDRFVAIVVSEVFVFARPLFGSANLSESALQQLIESRPHIDHLLRSLKIYGKLLGCDSRLLQE